MTESSECAHITLSTSPTNRSEVSNFSIRNRNKTEHKCTDYVDLDKDKRKSKVKVILFYFFPRRDVNKIDLFFKTNQLINGNKLI